MPPGTQDLAQALRGSDALARLTRRMQESQARLAALLPLLPPPLHTQVQAGPIDAEGHTLLAANAAVAAKLRYLLPAIEQSLADQGWPALPIRVRRLMAR